MNNKFTLTAEDLQEFSRMFNADRGNLVAANASAKSGLAQAATDFAAVSKLPYSFSTDLKQGSITDQKVSGRCWLFSALNTLRYEVIHKYNLDDFELSQNYLFFYDKLEKANYFLGNALRTLDEPVDGRLYSFLNADPLGDGGQWDMVANLIRKYGVVPKEAYPDTRNSIASRNFDMYLTSLLREYAIQLRKKAKAGASDDELEALRKNMMKTVYRVLVISLGEPPKTFDLTLTDKDGNVTQDFGLTGKTFFEKYVDFDLDAHISLINAPTPKKPMNKTYTVKFLGNVEEGAPVKYLNLPIETIKKAVVAQLKDGHPVWFGSDCLKFGSRDEAVFDRTASNIEQLLDIHYDFTKGERLDYGDSAMNHAMVFLGVNEDENGQPNRWRIENSWGKKAGAHDGYYIASDSWFDEFVYQVVVDKKYLEPEVAALFDQEPIELEPWDPMGSLA